MKRRSFLKSVLGFLALPFVPETKAKTIITDSKPIVGEFGSIGHIRWIRGKELPPSTEPLFEDLDPYPPEFKEVSGISARAIQKPIGMMVSHCSSKGYFYLLLENGEIWKSKLAEKANWELVAPLETEPEAYTAEDIEAARGINEEMFGDRAFYKDDQWTEAQKKELIKQHINKWANSIFGYYETKS